MLLQIDPVAFNIGGWSVYWYGLIIGLGMLSGYWLYSREAQRKGLDSDTAFDLFFWVIIIGFIGARIYYVIFSWDKYQSNPISALFIWQGGLAIYGGVIAGALTVAYFAKKYRYSLIDLADVSIPALMLGQVIGRWGNFMNQEAYGGPVSRDFLEGLFLPDWIINQMEIDGQYYHPTFLYESLWNFIGLIFILIFRGKDKFFKRGEITAFYLIWYGIGRFFIEGMRTDSLYLGNFRVSQLVSLIMIIIGIVYVIYIRRKDQTGLYYTDNRALS